MVRIRIPVSKFPFRKTGFVGCVLEPVVRKGPHCASTCSQGRLDTAVACCRYSVLTFTSHEDTHLNKEVVSHEMTGCRSAKHVVKRYRTFWQWWIHFHFMELRYGDLDGYISRTRSGNPSFLLNTKFIIFFTGTCSLSPLCARHLYSTTLHHIPLRCILILYFHLCLSLAEIA
jgi:hypothetical protein